MRFVTGFFMVIFFCCTSRAVHAQSFTVLHDTLYITSSASSLVADTVFNTTGAPVNIEWRVQATDFPPCWQEHTGICDPLACYQMPVLWPATGAISTSYGTVPDIITCATDLATCTPGCYYLTLRLNNAAIPTDTAYITFNVCYATTAVNAMGGQEQINVYPNPVQGVLHVAHAAGIAGVQLYDMTGRLVKEQMAGAASTVIATAGMPQGMYVLRLRGSDGSIAAVRKITIQ